MTFFAIKFKINASSEIGLLVISVTEFVYLKFLSYSKGVLLSNEPKIRRLVCYVSFTCLNKGVFMFKSPSVLDWIALVILFIGGLNWGLVGLFHFDLITGIFGDYSPIARIIYIIIGLCAIYVLVRAISCCKNHVSVP